MWGLSRELSKHFMIKVFADYIDNHKDFDEQASFSIERVGGIKLLRKYRKAQLINEFIKENKIQGIIGDHWKSLELIKTSKKKYCLIHSKEINHPKGSSQNKRFLNVLNNVEKVMNKDQIVNELEKISNFGINLLNSARENGVSVEEKFSDSNQHYFHGFAWYATYFKAIETAY